MNLDQQTRVGIELVGVDDEGHTSTIALIDRVIIPGIKEGLRDRGVVASVHLHWKPGLSSFELGPKQFIQAVVDLADREASNAKKGEEVVFEDDDEDQRLLELGLDDLDVLSITVGGLTQAEVLSSPPAIWMEGDEPVLAALLKKEKKLLEYRNRAQGGEVWLLITTGAAFSQNVAASMVSTKLVETGFDRVYLLDHNEQRTARLK